ncbi:MAG: aminoacyl-tRNA hydrolase [Bacteroidales bacterium]|nr:aminoacyl-tRNA hydrolase [Bacteroidales bacterium]
MAYLQNRGLEKEMEFQASRSGGPGGQHANKVSSKVELRFHVDSSEFLSEDEKQRIKKYLAHKLTKNGELLIESREARSQHQNKQLAVERFYSLLEWALKPRKKRKKTKPTKASKERRLKKKKEIAEKKQYRKPPDV